MSTPSYWVCLLVILFHHFELSYYFFTCGLLSLSPPLKVCCCISMYVIMVNLEDASTNNTLKLPSKDSSLWLYFPLRTKLLYPSINVSHGDYGSGLSSFSDEGNSPVSETAILITSLACAKFNLGLILFEIRVRETGYSISSLEKNPSC